MSEPVVRSPERFPSRIEIQRMRLDRLSTWIDRLKLRRDHTARAQQDCATPRGANPVSQEASDAS